MIAVGLIAPWAQFWPSTIALMEEAARTHTKTAEILRAVAARQSGGVAAQTLRNAELAERQAQAAMRRKDLLQQLAAYSAHRATLQQRSRPHAPAAGMLTGPDLPRLRAADRYPTVASHDGCPSPAPPGPSDDAAAGRWGPGSNPRATLDNLLSQALIRQGLGDGPGVTALLRQAKEVLDWSFTGPLAPPCRPERLPPPGPDRARAAA